MLYNIIPPRLAQGSTYIISLRGINNNYAERGEIAAANAAERNIKLFLNQIPN